MEELLEMANKVCDEAEVYSVEQNHRPVTFKDARIHDVDTKFQSGISLRLIKNGKIGFAYTRNLLEREELLQNALDSLKGGVGADYGFPFTRTIAELDTYDESVDKISGADMVSECSRVCDALKSKTGGEISASAFTYTERIRIINSSGTDVAGKTGMFGIYAGSVFPGSATGIWRVSLGKQFKGMSDDLLEQIVEVYNRSLDVVEPKGGKMKVMFMPNSMLTLNWRILSGTSSKSVYEKTTPVADKVGQEIFSEKITVIDDPLDDSRPGARAFDDEGVACSPLTLVDKGVLKGFYYDLHYASKLGAKATGHGYKSAQWGGDPISLKPVPSLSHMSIKPGTDSYWDIVKQMDRGVIMEGALGAHSGNIPNGDYSVGANPGLYVENGEILGRVKGTMVAGNIYETLKNVVAIGDTLYHANFGGWVPPLLLDKVSVATKG
jgi:PmbA protein